MDRFLSQHFLTVFLIVVFSFKLAALRDFKDTQIRYLWLSVICTALLVVQDLLEYSLLGPRQPSPWRLVLSVMGYVLRPMSALGILLVIAHDYPHRELLWIPAWTNAAIMSTAFFSRIAFYINENNHFGRGPLGYTTFIVGFIYIFLILLFLWKKYRFHFSLESAALYFCALGTVACTLIDHFYEGSRLNSAIIVSAIFYCMFLRSHDMNRDPMTGLLNRTAFYRDLEVGEKHINAMALFGLIGLRDINSAQGLHEGDSLLQEIGARLEKYEDKHLQCYRISDSEFLLIFLNSTEREARQVLENAQSSLRSNGYRISSGFAVRADHEGAEDLFLRVERAMKADRIAYFRQPGNNRRRE